VPRITLNGDAYATDGPLTISSLLTTLDIDPRRVAVERNFVIVKRDQYASTEIAEGDEIEIVNFVGGGSAHLRLLQQPRRRIGDREES
jgi:thiamine biosynthesis protein ThiS